MADKIVSPKSYNSLEALEAELNIPEIAPYSPCIGTDADGEKVYITFRSPFDLSYEEIEAANLAEASGDQLTAFRMNLTEEDMQKVIDMKLKFYQMGLLLGASQKYYDDAYKQVQAAGK